MMRFSQLLLACCVLFLSCDTTRAACSSTQLPIAYSETFSEKDANLKLKAAEVSGNGEMWLAADFMRKELRAGQLNAHLWKLDSKGKKVTDIEIKYPDTSKPIRQGGSSIAGLLLSSAGPKVYVNFSGAGEFWMLQFDEAGEIHEAHKVDREIEDIVAVESMREGETMIRQASDGLIHLTSNDTIDWKLTLPLKETEYTIGAAASDKEFFVATTEPTGDQIRTGLYRISASGKLLQQTVLPEINVGLSFVGGNLVMFHISTSRHSLSSIRLNDKDLHVERESLVPDLQELAIAVRATREGTWLIALKKDSTSVGLVKLNADQQIESFCPLTLPMDPKWLVMSLFDIKLFAAGDDLLFMYSFPNATLNEQVVAWNLPKH